MASAALVAHQTVGIDFGTPSPAFGVGESGTSGNLSSLFLRLLMELLQALE